MERKLLVKKVNEIELSTEMKERIIKNCYIEREENNMSKNKIKTIFSRPMVAVASFALCLCFVGITSFAATGKLNGFFKDITNWNGAVTGTSYEQATNEVKLSLTEISNKLEIDLTMLNPSIAPYNIFENFGIKDYKIIDMNGNIITEGNLEKTEKVIDGKVNIYISINNVKNGNYKLIINELLGSSKADQPLVLSGSWECEFTK